jgi:NADP-dependent 3-hydroxy acid dehydrogenase YdfG
MKMLVTGGNRGLGEAICNRFNGVSISREVGFDITKNVKQIVELSEKYDVFVNNAFDGPFHESWANFAQTKLLFSVAKAWKELGKRGHIINIGSVGTERTVAVDPEFKTGIVAFKTTLLTIDRLDTPLSQSRSNWTGNGLDLENICDYVDLILDSPDNTCVGEIVMWCKL